jgi:hypothetical protein
MDLIISSSHYIQLNKRDLIGYSAKIYESPNPVKLGNLFLGSIWKVLGYVT